MVAAIVKEGIVLFQGSYINIEYYPEYEWLYVNWIGEITKEAAVIGNEKILLALKKYPVRKILNDNSLITGSCDNAVIWLMEEGLPQFFCSGCMFVAWVQSSCIASQNSLQEALKYQSGNITVLVFEEVETASAWLKEV